MAIENVQPYLHDPKVTKEFPQLKVVFMAVKRIKAEIRKCRVKITIGRGTASDSYKLVASRNRQQNIDEDLNNESNEESCQESLVSSSEGSELNEEELNEEEITSFGLNLEHLIGKTYFILEGKKK